MSAMTFLLHRWFAFRPCKPRNPLLRVALGLVGLAVLLALVGVGLFVGLAMLLFAAARRLLATRPVPSSRPEGVIDGEYTLVSKGNAGLSLR